MIVRNSDLIALNIWMIEGAQLERNTHANIYNSMEGLRKIMKNLNHGSIPRTQVTSFLARVKLRNLSF
jgi:hypothetical protein